MKDLIISYDNENGNQIHREYDTIMDFLNEMTSDDIDIPMLDYINVNARFFENPLHDRTFGTIEDLYLHCKMMVI